MSKRCEKCGDSFLCAEHAQVQCGLSCPPDWPGHWRDWHSEDHNCATKGRAAAAKREPTGGTTTELIAALRDQLAAAERERDGAKEVEAILLGRYCEQHKQEVHGDYITCVRVPCDLCEQETLREETDILAGRERELAEKLVAAEAERDRLREILRRIASMDQPDTCVDCSTLYPGDGASWCWFCTAREALGEVKP